MWLGKKDVEKHKVIFKTIIQVHFKGELDCHNHFEGSLQWIFVPDWKNMKKKRINTEQIKLWLQRIGIANGYRKLWSLSQMIWELTNSKRQLKNNLSSLGWIELCCIVFLVRMKIYFSSVPSQHFYIQESFPKNKLTEIQLQARTFIELEPLLKRNYKI